MNSPLSAPFKYVVYVFYAITVINAIGLLNEVKIIEQVTKPMLVPILALYYCSRKDRDSSYLLAILFSWAGNLMIMNIGFSTVLGGFISFWATLLLFLDHIIKRLKGNLLDQFKKKNSWIIASIFALYLSGIILKVYKGAGMLTPAILFYGTTLTGTGFLSVLLWFEKKKK